MVARPSMSGLEAIWIVPTSESCYVAVEAVLLVCTSSLNLFAKFAKDLGIEGRF